MDENETAAPATAEDGDEASGLAPLVDVSVGQQVTVSHMGMRYNAEVRQVTDSSRGRRALVHYRRNGDAPVTEWVALSRLSQAGRVRTSPRNNPSTASRLAAVSAAASGGGGGGPSAATAESLALVVRDDDSCASAAHALPRAAGNGRARGPAATATSTSASTSAAAAAAAPSSAAATGAAALPEGWATAAAAETLREFGERKFYAADWFSAFSAHAITKRSGEPPGRLLARFVVAVNDLQMLGLCHASKRPRGTIEKRFFG